MSKYKLPNGLIVSVDDETGAGTVESGGGRSLAPGTRLTEGGDFLGKAPTAEQRPSALTGPGATDPDAPSTQAATSPAPGAGSNASATVAAPFEGIARATKHANDFAVNAISHPVDTARSVAENPASYAREAMRGVNDNIPFANRGVEAIGGPPASSPEDEAAAPNVRDFASTVSSLPVGGVEGDIAKAAGQGVADIGKNAAARVAKRAGDVTNVTGGANTAAARKAVSARNIYAEATAADPQLGEVLSGPGDNATKHAAASGRLNELKSANDADFFKLGDMHPDANAIEGRVPSAPFKAKLEGLKAEAHAKGDPTDIVGSVDTVLDKLKRFDERGTVSPEQVRGIRNGLAAKAAHGSEAEAVEKLNNNKIRSTLNDVISDMVSETPGMDAVAHRARNRQIAGLLPVKDFLEGELEKEAAVPQRGIIGKAVDLAGQVNVEKPLSNFTKPALAAADRIIPAVDRHLARLAGNTGLAGVAALKAVVLRPTRETLQEAIRVGIPAQVALQVARLGSQPVGAQ